MILKASPAMAMLSSQSNTTCPLFSTVSSPFSSYGSSLKSFHRNSGFQVLVCAAKGSNNRPLTGVIFEPFEEVKKTLMLVPASPQQSLARQKYVDECEAAINEQIKLVPPSISLFIIFCRSIRIQIQYPNPRSHMIYVET